MDGNEFKRIRHRLGLSAAALGHALGYRGSETNIARTIYRLESGRPVPRPIARLLVMFDAYGVPRAWAGETEQLRHNARPKWYDHSAFSEATLGADLMGVAMQRIAARRGARLQSVASITKTQRDSQDLSRGVAYSIYNQPRVVSPPGTVRATVSVAASSG